MTRPRAEAGRVHWLALVAIAVLVAGVGIAWRQSRVPRVPGSQAAPAAEPATEPSTEPPGQVVEQALRQAAPFDSAAFKQRWIDEVRGADLSGLDSTRRELFLRFANAEQCTCGCGYTLAGCRASDMTCDISGPRVTALLDSVRTGRLHGARGIRSRPHPTG
jgi:hypothetical protein